MKARKTNNEQITLGDGWRKFAFERLDLEYLGVIRRGIEIGALAKDEGGAFLQVNGDMRQPLNTSRIQALLRSARPDIRSAPIARQPSAEQRSAVVVTVKPKRRTIVRA
ncbi:hypothetical protein JY96_06845 [Aquabacterium sp. NJ1]|uniref:hypothetical protein n=1 Tax=Aquabacterium sp. NJ1 TaxID=1538295 RepID=UPI00052D8BF0|nr:hypothetical protein [Aquabacterium sp. NJ1]KGM39842.1 hypothetical protein JY96_06845 [Aquabacterium sp. NJ1]